MIDSSPTEGQVNHFRAFGFVQLERCIDGAAFGTLVEEYERALSPSSGRLPFNLAGRPPAWVASCMGERTPNIAGLALSERALALAERLLGGPVICVQASAYWRSEDTQWHSDNPGLDYEALKLYINLDPVDGGSGALRVVPGSHRDPLRTALAPGAGERLEDAFGVAADRLPAVALCSRAGDVSAFDLRLWHAVCGSGRKRRVVELSYYGDPTRPSSRQGFIQQMRANQRGARLAGEPYFPAFWRQAPGARHQRGIRRLAELGVLDSGRS